MTDRPKDENEKRKLRVVPTGAERTEIDPEKEITLEALLNERGLSTDENEAEEVIVRRIDRKLAAREKADYPWTRRFIGFAIILAAFYFGWKSLNRQSAEILRRKAEMAAQKPPLSPLGEAPANQPGTSPSPTQTAQDAAVSPLTLPAGAPLMSAPLDIATVNTISECTKGVNAFRQLDLRRKKSENGETTLESVFEPALDTGNDRAKRVVNLQNVRIRTKTGAEWRLHASPQSQTGELHLKLFRVANDGLPEEIPFPPAIKDLADAPLTDAAVTRFLTFSENGSPLEIERHEAWSYPGKAGAQVIWSDGQIFDIQVFMAEKFLACSRGVRSGKPTVNCKCVDHHKKDGR